MTAAPRSGMSILAWIVLGLIAGAIAKALHPGPDPGGLLATLVIGVLGAFIGGFIGRAAFGMGISGFDVRSFLLAIGGAFLLLVIYRLAVTARPRRQA
jgi:uncharacterized membrane protein YeaQ/YmgE (transglycosylase-associated protein family)